MSTILICVVPQPAIDALALPKLWEDEHAARKFVCFSNSDIQITQGLKRVEATQTDDVYALIHEDERDVRDIVCAAVPTVILRFFHREETDSVYKAISSFAKGENRVKSFDAIATTIAVSWALESRFELLLRFALPGASPLPVSPSAGDIFTDARLRHAYQQYSHNSVPDPDGRLAKILQKYSDTSLNAVSALTVQNCVYALSVQFDPVIAQHLRDSLLGS